MDISGFKLIAAGADEGFGDLSGKILSVLDPESLAPLELWKKLEVVSKADVVSAIRQFGGSGAFVLFTGRSAIYRLSKSQAAALINDEFDSDTDEGIDIVLCDDAFTVAFLGNHDGMLLQNK